MKHYGAVKYKRIKVTDAERTENMQKLLSGDGSRLRCGEDRHGSLKECIRTEQVTDNERSTNTQVTDV